MTFNSYLKTATVCAALLGLALGAVFGAIGRWSGAIGLLVVAVCVASVLVALAAFCSCVVVLARHRRALRGERDLYLELNRSRDVSSLTAAPLREVSAVRRWLAKRLLGHAMIVGDLVEIRPWAEIRATLDHEGRLENLPFMTEMRALCGRRARVLRCVHRIFDYRRSRRMRHLDGAVLLAGMVCDGGAHSGCAASCRIIWKAAWLRRLELDESSRVNPVKVGEAGDPPGEPGWMSPQPGPRYHCQLTQLHAASRPVGEWSIGNFLRPLVSGNVTPSAFIVGWLTHLFCELQHLRGGISFPDFEPVIADGEAPEPQRLSAGEFVAVRSREEIRRTLNGQSQNRGLYFEPDMLKHCGQRYRVKSEVNQLIDIVSGEMLRMKTPAFILEDVVFSGERQQFNAQCEPLFWRSVWLRRDES